MPEPPVIELDERPHNRFVELLVAVSATVGVNPFRGATVIIEVALAPAFAFTLVGLAVRVKSGALVT